MGGARLLESEAGLEEAARLAPQLGVGAQAPERRQKLRVALALEEPLLGALDALARLAVARVLGHVLRQLAVQHYQPRRPLGGKRLLDDVARQRRAIQHRR